MGKGQCHGYAYGYKGCGTSDKEGEYYPHRRKENEKWQGDKYQVFF